MGTTGTAIVAIPAVDDQVWKVSSEKKPHLTLLFLGDNVSDEEHAQIALFLQHIAETTLRRFGLSVDRRGDLGDEGADVLFFSKKWGFTKDIEDARGFLLANDTINKLYHSTTQFESWIPHLTVGYPATPANDDAVDYPISYVRFDKIALWTGEYDGPEFDLEEDNSMAESVAWTDQMDEVLAHYGVKGMKWGVRKSEGANGTQAKRAKVPDSISEDKQAANAAASRVTKKGDTSALSNKELQQLVNRMNLEQQYSRLSSEPGRLKTGEKRAKDILNTGKTINEVVTFAQSPLGKAIRKVMEPRFRRAVIGTAVVAGKLAGKLARR